MTLTSFFVLLIIYLVRQLLFYIIQSKYECQNILSRIGILTDPIIRNSSDVNLPNSVVILDEAHNVEDTCRDSASFDFEEEELHQAIGSVAQKSVNLLLQHWRKH